MQSCEVDGPTLSTSSTVETGDHPSSRHYPYTNELYYDERSRYALSFFLLPKSNSHLIERLVHNLPQRFDQIPKDQLPAIASTIALHWLPLKEFLRAVFDGRQQWFLKIDPPIPICRVTTSVIVRHKKALKKLFFPDDEECANGIDNASGSTENEDDNDAAIGNDDDDDESDSKRKRSKKVENAK
eukprot:Awhi_evm2s9174